MHAPKRRDKEGKTPQGPATVKDIARAAGVSVGTVDRVLHNRGRVSNETTARVRQAVARHKYSPNVVASNLSRARRLVFGVLMPGPGQDGGYWEFPIAGIRSAVEELAHHYLTVEYYHFYRDDDASFWAAAERLLEATVDGVLLAPTLYEESKTFVDRLQGTPCVVFDGELPSAGVLTTVNQDSFESGLLAGKLMKLLAPQGPYLTATIGRTDYHLRRRREGFVRFFELSGEGPVEHLDLEQPKELLRTADQIRSGASAMGGLFATNALGHYLAKELNDSDTSHTPIIGYDLIPENADSLRNGLMDFVIHQEPRRQGYSSLYALYRHVVLKEAVEPRIRMPIDIVMRENLEFHMNRETTERPAPRTKVKEQQP